MSTEYDLPIITSDVSKSQLFDIIFNKLSEAARDIQNLDSAPNGIERLVPRLLELREQRPELKELDGIIGSLARSVGLWNYLDEFELENRDCIIRDVARANTEKLKNRILHKEQWRIFNQLYSGKNVILSAPTSFGKSLLIDVLLASTKYKKIAIIVPTLALLDETRKRLWQAFGDDYDIITHHSENPEKTGVIFIGTQERLITREDLIDLDLLIVDEFYKLDPSRRDERSISLNAAVYKLLSRAKQFFFLGPNIDSVVIKDDSLWKFDFIKTRFSTVAVDTFDLRHLDDREKLLIQEAKKSENWPTLIFASSPDRANDLLSKLSASEFVFQKGVPKLAEWIQDNYWSKWPLSSSIKKGSAVHHGRLPRALAVKLVHEFSAGNLGALVCTSTLIEGVNTAAKSVMIFDKKIYRSNYDFFTFANIRGRAGRLGQHYIGKVFLFNDPPDESDVNIETPLFGDLNDAPDQLIVHFEADRLSSTTNNRIEVIANKVGLSAIDLQRFTSIDLDEIQQYNENIKQLIKTQALPLWSGYPPSYDDLKSLCQLTCSVCLPSKFGVYTDKQLSYFLNQLQHSRKIADFFNWFGESNEDKPENFDSIFRFLRACEYGIGEYFTLIETLINNHIPNAVDYSPYIADLKNLFRAECIKVLDERGIPIQMSEKVYSTNDTIKSLTNKLVDSALNKSSFFTEYEREWIIETLV